MKSLAAQMPIGGSSARPSSPQQFASRYAAARPLEFEASDNKLNHHVFRYPAKFHAPIARRLVEMFSQPGDTVLDPFCGSGTLLVEAATLGRHSVGTDVDPLAVMVSQAKTTLTDIVMLEAASESFLSWLDEERGKDETRWGGFESDITPAAFDEGKADLAAYIPALPRIDHWFRRRAVLQLAAIRRRIEETLTGEALVFQRLCFAAIIRNSSNADPVPISGLEVTSHMLAKEKAGRAIDPWRLMARAISKALPATKAFAEARGNVTAAVHLADARSLDAAELGRVNAVITSPPYLTAVDYYRRHTLEMYWLGLTVKRDERLTLMARYIGRDRVGAIHLPVGEAAGKAVADRWLPRFANIKPERERAFRHYCDGMARALAGMTKLVTDGGPVVVVAGDVRFCGVPVSMLELMADLAGDGMVVSDHLWYPITNRYMSYTRQNEANIAADHVIVLRAKS